MKDGGNGGNPLEIQGVLRAKATADLEAEVLDELKDSPPEQSIAKIMDEFFKRVRRANQPINPDEGASPEETREKEAKPAGGQE